MAEQDDYTNLIGYQTKPMASPAAQTFTPQQDFYADAVQLYFTSKNDKESNPIYLQLRDTSNGYPNGTVYGHTVVMQPSDLQIDPQGQVPTKFKFADPVFLQGGHQYALVIETNSTQYELAISVFSHLSGENTAQGDHSYANPNSRIGGTFCYSMDGHDWTSGDPTDTYKASGGTLCLKFSVNKAVFDPSKSSVVTYHGFDLRNYTYPNSNINLDQISYLTFSPEVFTPDNTRITWKYNFDDKDVDDAHVFNPAKSLAVPQNRGTVENFYVWAFLHGSDTITPCIDNGSIQVHSQLNMTSGDHHDDTPGVYPLDNSTHAHLQVVNPFTSEVGYSNSGEYISRNIPLVQNNGATSNKAINQLYFSYQYMSNGAPLPDVYVNFGADGRRTNPFRDFWVLVPGYDVFVSAASLGDQDSNPKDGAYFTIDPTGQNDPLVNKTNPQVDIPKASELNDILPLNDYHEQVSGGHNGSAWIKYSYHLSLRRLANTVNNANDKGITVYGYEHQNDDVKQPLKNHSLNINQRLLNPRVQSSSVHANQNVNSLAQEVKFKIIFHNSSSLVHPKLRSFMSHGDVNNSEDQDNEIKVTD